MGLAQVVSGATLAVFRGRAGDRNERGMLGAELIGKALAERYGLTRSQIRTPGKPLGARWDVELESAREGLKAFSSHIESVVRAGSRPLTAMGRCATALATLPVIGRLRPQAKVVWFDAHGDCNTPETSMTGYLGGLVLTGAAGLWDTGLGAGLDLANVVLVGARDIDPAEKLLIASGRPRLVEASKDLPQKLDDVLGDSPVYVHLDCDVLEPGIVPTEYRVPGGLTLAQLTAAFSVLAQRQIVGFEIAEFEAYEAGDTKAASPAMLLDALDPFLSALVR